MHKEAAAETSSNDEENHDLEIKRIPIRRSYHWGEKMTGATEMSNSTSDETESSVNDLTKLRISTAVPKKGFTSSNKLRVPTSEKDLRQSPSNSISDFNTFNSRQPAEAKSSGEKNERFYRGDEKKTASQARLLEDAEKQRSAQMAEKIQNLKQQDLENRRAYEKKANELKLIQQFEKETSSENEEPRFVERVKETFIKQVRNYRLGVLRNGKRKAVKVIKRASIVAFRQ